MEPDEYVRLCVTAERGECFRLTPELRWRVTLSGTRVLQQKSEIGRAHV